MEEEIAEKYLSWKQEQKAGPKGSVFLCKISDEIFIENNYETVIMKTKAENKKEKGVL